MLQSQPGKSELACFTARTNQATAPTYHFGKLEGISTDPPLLPIQRLDSDRGQEKQNGGREEREYALFEQQGEIECSCARFDRRPKSMVWVPYALRRCTPSHGAADGGNRETCVQDISRRPTPAAEVILRRYGVSSNGQMAATCRSCADQ